MSKYGTIPTTSSTPPPGGSTSSSSPVDFISRAKARGASALATRRPWRELADPRALSVPRGFSAAYRRARANLAHFAANYALVVLLVVFVSLLWRPVSMLVFLACFAAWLVLYFLRDRDVDGALVVCGRGVGDGVVIAVLSAATLVLLLLTGATGFILTSLLVGLLLVLLHALLHRPADSIDDEAGRWYTPVPPSSY
ncbi:PRA1 family protein F3-like [Miscanthus floridulus]|uniref:PRA1 family protein F3-like n=1 Tax=Miscanthus floridulus TaxID=154761 RepID=UPI003459A2E6